MTYALCYACCDAGTIADFLVVRSAERLKRAKISSAVEEISIEEGGSQQAREILTNGACIEHTTAYAMLGQPTSALEVVWISSILVKGIRVTAKTWIMIRSSIDAPLYIACVQGIFYVCEPNSRDKLFFVSALACSCHELEIQEQGTLGFFKVREQSLRERMHHRVFACLSPEVGELVKAHHCSGDTITFVMCP